MVATRVRLRLHIWSIDFSGSSLAMISIKVDFVELAKVYVQLPVTSRLNVSSAGTIQPDLISETKHKAILVNGSSSSAYTCLQSMLY